jgi:hypothetical protein
MEGAPEGGARMALVEIGPEQGEQGIATVEAPGKVGGQVGQEREPLRLAQHRFGLPSVRGAEVHRAEGAELDHGR